MPYWGRLDPDRRHFPANLTVRTPIILLVRFPGVPPGLQSVVPTGLQEKGMVFAGWIHQARKSLSARDGIRWARLWRLGDWPCYNPHHANSQNPSLRRGSVSRSPAVRAAGRMASGDLWSCSLLRVEWLREVNRSPCSSRALADGWAMARHPRCQTQGKERGPHMAPC
jgi:hypothetical protein